MAYQRPQAPQGAPSKGSFTSKPAPVTKVNAGGPSQSTGAAKKGSRPDFEIVAVDAEGSIVKEPKVIDGVEKMVSRRLGAIWKSTFEDGVQLVQMETGERAKIFPVKARN